MWLIEVKTGQAKRVLRFDTGIPLPRWSGRFIYFVGHAREYGEPVLWRVAVDMQSGTHLSDPVQVLTDARVGALNLSRDGKKLIYTKDQIDERLWQIPLDAASENPWASAKLLESHTKGTGNLDISPDGKHLILETQHGTLRTLILFSPVDGSQALLYDQNPAFAPAWSHDGRWIIFDAGGGNDADIWRIPATGGNAEKIIEHPGADWMPTYSPDGKKICFLSNRGGQFDLWVYSTATGETQQITHTPETESGGYWSHDGLRIAFIRNYTAENSSGIWLYDFENQREHKILHFPDLQIDILTKILWRADDGALYFAKDSYDGGTNIFTEFIFATQEIRHPLDVDGHHTRDVYYTLYKNELFLMERKFHSSQSVHKLKILSVICLPLIHDSEVFGAVYLDNRTVLGAFSPESFHFAEKFADFISVAARHALEKTKLHNRVEALEKELREKCQFQTIVGEHPAMVEILNLIAQIADTMATVLVQGESGTGKELIARALHTNSHRKDQPFVPINCSALPENLLESELFGHVRGAFTGATENKIGWFERANAGTIFLDEVSEMSPALQAKLLRVLQNGEISPLGSTTIRRCDVRVVAATNRDLRQLVEKDLFRQDLFYRLNVIGIDIPPLRERRTDIPLLTQHFLRRFSDKYKKKNLQLSPQAMAQLLTYNFPGNVRELENIIERAVILANGKRIEVDHLPANLHAKRTPLAGESGVLTFKAAKRKLLETFEREFIVEHLLQTEGNISQAAKSCGMDMKNFI